MLTLNHSLLPLLVRIHQKLQIHVKSNPVNRTLALLLRCLSVPEILHRGAYEFFLHHMIFSVLMWFHKCRKKYFVKFSKIYEFLKSNPWSKNCYVFILNYPFSIRYCSWSHNKVIYKLAHKWFFKTKKIFLRKLFLFTRL